MIGIQAIVDEIPDARVEVARLAPAVGVDDQLMQKFGFLRLARRHPTQETSDLYLAAAEKLIHPNGFNPDQIECLCVITQSPDGYGVPNVAAILHAKLGLPKSCASFDLSLGGSGYVYGLAIVKSFMESNRLKRGLLVTCEPHSRVVDELDGHAGCYSEMPQLLRGLAIVLSGQLVSAALGPGARKVI